MPNRHSLRPAIAALALVFATAEQAAVFAQSGTWVNNAGGDYDTPANWAGNQVAGGAGNTADFSTLDLTTDLSVTKNTPLTIGNLIFGDANTTTGGTWELRTDLPAIAVITLDNGASKPNLTVNTLTPTLFDDAFIAHSLAGTMGFNKLGAGILTLGPGTTNTITGGINVNAGTLRLNAAIPGQTIGIANGATLETSVSLDAGSGHQINVASGAIGTIRARASTTLGNIDADGATLNLHIVSAGNTLTADNNWAINGSPAVVNVSSSAGGFLRLRPNGGSFDSTTAFATSHVTLDNVTVFTRTNSTGNDINIGALSGTSSAVLGGGAQGGGTVARYTIGSLNQDTVFAGTIDSSGAGVPTPLGGINLIKVGTGKLTLSGTIDNAPQVVGTSAATDPTRRGGVTQIQSGVLALTNTATITGGIVDGTAGTVLTTIDVHAAGTLDVTGYTGTYQTQALQQVVGTGTILGNWNHADGLIRPGNTVVNFSADTTAAAGTIHFDGDLILGGGGITFDLSLDPSAGNDLVHVTGTTTITGGTIAAHFLAAAPTDGVYTVLTSDGGLIGDVASLTLDFPGAGDGAVLFQEGNSIKLSVPEPSAMALLLLSGLTCLTRRSPRSRR